MFTGNSTQMGGAVYGIQEVKALITRCGFHENRCIGKRMPQVGGAIAIGSKSSLFMKNTNVTNNTAGLMGGGIHVEGSGVVLENCRFLSNKAMLGGGLSLAHLSYISTSGTVFFRNEASTLGGAVFLLSSDANYIFDNITCVANRGPSGGGCFFVNSSIFTSSNSDIKQNGAGSGKDLFIAASRMQVSDTLIVLTVVLEKIIYH